MSQLPMEIMKKFRSFMESRILLTGAELDLYTLLAKEALTVEAIVKETGYHRRPLVMVLDALCAVGALEKADGRYATPKELAPMLSADSPGTMLPMALHAAGLWRRWSNLTTIVRDTGVSDNPPLTERDAEGMKAFIGAMHSVGALQARQFVENVGRDGFKRLIDIGGATGTYAEAFLLAYPDMTATLFDLPQVIDLARERLGPTGLLDRLTLVEGDYYKDPLPGGHDLALVSAIIHSLSLEQCGDLYKKAHDALTPGGRIIVRDHVMSPDRTEPASGAIFAINMLTGTKGGGTYTLAEIKAGLEAAGFERVAQLQADVQMTGTVEAYKPA